MGQELLKGKIKERYGKIALSGSDCCCTPQECCDTIDFNPKQSSLTIGYDYKTLETIPQSSILGLGCGAPVNFAKLKEGETVVDLGSGAGIDVFLASRQVKDIGKVIGCVINLATEKVEAFKEVYRILKKGGRGRMVISDLVTSKEVHSDSVNAEAWCSCIDGALTRQNYIKSIKDAGFQNVEVLDEKLYLDEDKTEGRKITSLVIRAETG